MRSAEPIEPHGERLLQGRRNRLRAALLAFSKRRRVADSSAFNIAPDNSEFRVCPLAT
jgi:hypothetical protein